ncbi:histidine kinase [Pseudomonas sp. Fl5BN2]|uniref:sensor histidine kinase n=1 Tax=Pseudomonas sp. Fl5BN2 TaxID=2697652 RepID=UPI0013788173|nr:sensor histidine kinase [Pseudomonas sp. Fl5BN2]NBF03221.1 histidine kinase [Pseudomonas sp. Fl5BN2]
MKTTRLLFFFLTLFGFASWLQAATLQLMPEAGTTPATGYLQRLDDPGGMLTPTQALQAGDWQSLPSSLNAGFTSVHIWLRVQVRAPGEGKQNWALRLSNAVLDDVRLYQRDAQGNWQEQRSGEDLPREQWPVDYRSPVLPLTLQGGKSEVLLLRLHTKNALSVGLEFSTRQQFSESTRREFLGYGLYFGVYLMLIGFHSVFWRLTQAPESGWYLLYVGCCVWIEALTVGLPQQLLSIPVGLSDPLLGAALALGLPIGVVFASRQLALAQVYQRFAALLICLTWLVGVVAAIFVLFGYYRDAVPVVLAFSLVMIPIFLCLAIWLLLRGHRPARFYLLAFGIYYAGVSIAFLRNFGVLPATFWTDNAVALGTLLHMGIMSCRIISHYNQLKRDKVHAQRQATELIQQQNAYLEAQVLARTCELNEELRCRELLEQELRVALLREQDIREQQSDFVAMVSHEFRTPLAIINTLAQQLARHLDAPAEKNLRRCQNIREAGTRLLVLVDDYLTHDHMADAQPTTRFVACDLAALLKGLLTDWSPGRIAFDYRLAAGNYWCDAGLLHVAVRNLLANANRHAPAQSSLRLVVWEEEGRICLTVSHPGPLIPEDERVRLFNKYYRGAQAQTSVGAGLGLYMVQRIAELHAGEIALIGYGGEADICFRLSLCLSRALAKEEARSAALAAL